MIRPSSLPCLAQCPAFLSGPAHDFTDAGTVRHDGLARFLRGDPDWSESVPEDERDGVEWAGDYIRVHSPTDEHVLHIEEKTGAAYDDEFNPLWGDDVGTADAFCGSKLFDLKWRRRDYTAQMAAYALARIQHENLLSVTCHVLYAESKYAQVMEFTEESAAKIVGGIIKSAQCNPAPRQCDYCGWCAKQAACSAVIAPVKQIVDARDEISDADKKAFSDWLSAGAHTAQIPDDAKLLGMILTIAKAVGKWSAAAEHHVKEAAVKRGVIADGYRLQTRQSNRYIESVDAAFARMGLPQGEFLKACGVGFSNLVEVTKNLHGLKKAQAERMVEEKLGDALKRKESSISLVKVKGE